ncbi:MAG: hypothetical protein GX929_00325 [Clostridiales bacterium]|nr:hypothetical protein [Clostridiales bacterium]
MKLRDKLWIWGQNAGTHHNTRNGNVWNLPGTNRMTPLEGCYYMGIPNCCRVVMGGIPTPPFDQEAMVLDTLGQVVWSIIGDGGSHREGEAVDLDEVIRIAKKHPNVTGGIMDDFMNPSRMAIYTPDKLKMYRECLNNAIPGRKLDLWTVIYTHELKDEAIPYLAEIDRVSFWTWSGHKLLNLDENFARLRELIGPDKPVLCGCYMWNYGNRAPMPMDLMEYQLDKYYQWLKNGTIEGIIFCSNTIADLEIKAVDYARAWIKAHGDEDI